MASKLQTNVLYYGDNLHILRNRHYFPDESIDLIYLDPPFNSNRSYNVLFKESSGAGSEAQIEAFEDAWHWGPHAQEAYEQIMVSEHQGVARILRAMVEGLGHNDVTAYLTMMAIRLVELHRALKPTGSIYLHCDPTASHYLKLLMDSVFRPGNFVNEIIWQRTGAHSDARRWGRVTDTILYYAKSDAWTWNTEFAEYSEDYIKERYRYKDEATGRLYWRNTMTAAGPGPARVFRGVSRNPPSGTHWRFSQGQIDRMEAEERIYYSPNGMPYVKSYLNERKGRVVQNLWTDIVMSKSGKERLHYATQKPLALLERIITASSSPGDIVLDPFCGCGTAVHAAEKLGRKWIGIDITHLAIGLIRRRMRDAFPGIEIKVIGEPVDLAGARELAARDKYQFQWWVLDRIGAQPVSGKKKGADKGIDGVVPFFDGPKTDFKRVLVSVKGGEHVGVGAVRELRAVLAREKEPIGVLVTLARPTREMTAEAAGVGSYANEFWKKKYPRIQILTVEQILKGKLPDMPPQRSPFAQAPLEREQAEQPRLV